MTAIIINKRQFNMVTATEREAFFQDKLIEKYGAEYGITTELLNKIYRGTATEEELNTFTQSADKMVVKFKEDMRTTEPENYANQDIEIVMAMIDANYLNFKNKQEPFSKVIPESGVQDLLTKKFGNPSILNFSASSSHSENLSPQQIVSQFGLDYEYEDNGETVTPYLVKDGDNIQRQPFVYAIETPMNEGIKANAKLPIDPRIMERFEQIANDAQLPPETRQQAKDFLARNKDNFCLIVRNIEDKEHLQQKYLDKYEIISAQDAPYTGNTAPQHGTKLKSQDAYVDIVQEMFVTKPTEVSPGTKIYAKFPQEKVDSERADLPAGSKKVPIAEWDGKEWKVIVNDKELDTQFKRTLNNYSDNVKEKLNKKTVSSKQLRDWKQIGDSPQKPKELDTHIQNNSSKLINRLQTQTSVLSKLRRRKKKKQKASSNN